ncbi:MAG: protease complex subunit PrcB family protein [Balneolaceae bacterium]|nr:protease complex subunit PrcB family protein [Balneolaceae bacterium]
MNATRNFVSILVAVVLSLPGCEQSAWNDGEADAFFEAADPVPFETIEREPVGNTEVGAQNRIIRDPVEFREVWNGLHEGQHPQPEVPAVDFTREMVVVTVMGTRPTGGYLSEITDVASASGVLGVRVVHTIPGDDCGVTAALTNPYHIVRIDRNSLEGRFFKEELVSNCTD